MLALFGATICGLGCFWAYTMAHNPAIILPIVVIQIGMCIACTDRN